MYQKVKAYVEKHHMLKNGDKVIVGVSGGADSICLLFMLLALQEEINFEILAAHVHHGLRKESADADERYVRKICEKQEVELRVFHEDVKTYAKKYGLTEEEAGRNIRREVLGRLCEEERGTRIALAHHRNDNVETLLWNLARGTGIRGAGGIRPVNGVWIRPLLCVERTEIELYLEKWRISYCTDETNLEDAYTRNRLRNHVIPYFEEHINRRTVEHMAEAVEQFRLLGEYVEAEAEKYRCMCVKENEGRIL
ncbi:MAG: tRNA lysidine(34) synthetase TilS, partial [Dorea sp.]